MIELFTIKKEYFKTITDIILNLTPDIELIVDDNVYCCFTDTAHVAMCQMSLTTPVAEKTAMKIPLRIVSQKVGIPKNDVIVGVDNNKAVFISSKKPKVEHKITKLADGSVKTWDFKVLPDYKVKVALSHADVEQIVSLLKVITSTKDYSIYLGLRKVGNVLEVFETAEENNTKIYIENGVEGEDSLSHYPPDYVLGLLQSYKMFPEITLKFSTDYPMLINMRTDDLSFDVLVAPRILNDD